MKLLLFILLIFLCACTQMEEDLFVLPDNATALLAGANNKSWKLARRYNGKNRMNMGDCFLSYRQTFQTNFRVHDNSGDFPDCGPTLHAQWKWVQAENGHPYLKLSSPQISELMNIDVDYKFFKVLHLSEEELVLQYLHQQYAQKRMITDILVPEGIEVEDRNFHW